MWTTRTRVGWTIVLIGSFTVALTSARYLTLNPEVFFPRQREIYEANTLMLIVHIAGMLVAAVVGPFQFLRFLRDRRRWLHRWTGRLYIVSALIGGVGGLYMAQYSASGWVSDIGFGSMAVLVLTFTSLAYLRIRAGNVQAHREWMTRSFALIFGAVTLRIYLPLLEGALGEQDGYALVAWLAWVPNLIGAEWLVRSHLRVRPEPLLAVA